MGSGAEKAKETIKAFELWMATQTDDSYRQLSYRGNLSRGEIAQAIGCGRSALVQNPGLRRQLQQLEYQLRERGVLPPLSAQATASIDHPRAYDPTAHRRLLDTKRVSTLEQENIELKAQLRELKARLERFGELSETLAEMGILPR
ncbi:VPA1267 family protein [Aeromonas media]|uniref:VPA1267 family protein n=1 Tax=Aeromonas media TaxID=651 RepID=UPI000DD045CA|nr:VPA1267 family protein [Aeromonas media]